MWSVTAAHNATGVQAKVQFTSTPGWLERLIQMLDALSRNAPKSVELLVATWVVPVLVDLSERAGCGCSADRQ
jgi:hypothetical protein